MSQAINNMSVTWSDGSLQTGIKLNVTDTSSSASSLLMDLGTGGGSYTSRFGVLKDGNVYLQGGTSTHFIANSNGGGLACNNSGLNDGSYDAVYTGYGPRFNLAASIGWVSTSTLPSSGGSPDLSLFRDAANTLAQRNGTNAQTFRIYNTYTDASNYERAKIAWSSNVLQIGTEKLGTGTARALEFQTDGVTRLTINTSGNTTLSGALIIGSSSSFSHSGRVIFNSPAAGVYTLQNNTQTDWDRLQFGGTTNSFPAIKRSTTSLQARLADDSAFTNIQGKLTTETAYTAGAPTATGYLVLYDSNGTAYKVPAEAL